MTTPGAPIQIFIGGALLTSWVSMTLQRAKKDMTGDLTVQVFRGHMPDQPIFTELRHGADITVYIGGHLAFTGGLDKRKGKGKGSKGSDQVAPSYSKNIHGSKQTRGGGTHIDANKYTLTIRARGKTRQFIDSSHKDETGTVPNTTHKAAIERLMRPFGVELDWRARDQQAGTIRYTDGGNAAEELFRIANENATWLWESRDGRLIASDMTLGAQGEPLILGNNILEFDAEQSDDMSDAEYEVKGQRTRKNLWGKEAVKRRRRIKDEWSRAGATRLSLQYNGDATDAALERRAKYEADNRTAESKKVTCKVYHVMSRTGQPWDIGQEHYVEVPPEGIFEVMECTTLSYHCDFDKEIVTTLGLTPLPSSGVAGGIGALAVGLAAGNAARSDAASLGAQRRQQIGFAYREGHYPAPWGSAVLAAVDIAETAVADLNAVVQPVVRAPPPPRPPLTPPPQFRMIKA